MPQSTDQPINRPTRKRFAFTLVELLVVVAIIVALLAMLLPSMNRAMAVAQQALCGSNQRQIGLALSTYLGQNKRTFPAGVHNTTGDWLWPAQLRREIGGSMEVFYCPTADPKCQWIRKLGSGTPADAYGWEADEVRLGSNRGSWFSYGLNVWGYPAVTDSAFGTGTYNDLSGDGYKSINDVISISTFILLADSNWDLAAGGDIHWSAYVGGYALRQYPGPIHSSRSNTLRADGHVEARTRDELITFSADVAINRQWNRDNQPHW